MAGIGGISGGQEGMGVALLAKSLGAQEKIATSLINDTLAELNKVKPTASEKMKMEFQSQTKMLGAALTGKGLNLDTIV